MGRTSIYLCFCGVLSAAGGDPTAKPVELLLEADPVLAGYSSLCRDDAESVVAGTEVRCTHVAVHERVWCLQGTCATSSAAGEKQRI